MTLFEGGAIGLATPSIPRVECNVRMGGADAGYFALSTCKVHR
jgi:hypothetical protein